MSIKDMTLRTKLLAAFLVPALLAGLIGATGIAELGNLRRIMSEEYEQRAVPLMILEGLAMSFGRPNSTPLTLFARPLRPTCGARTTKACGSPLPSRSNSSRNSQRSATHPRSGSAW